MRITGAHLRFIQYRQSSAFQPSSRSTLASCSRGSLRFAKNWAAFRTTLKIGARVANAVAKQKIVDVMNVRHNWRICCPPDKWFQAAGDTSTLSVADVHRRVLVVNVAPAADVPSPVVVWTSVVWDALAVVVVV